MPAMAGDESMTMYVIYEHPRDFREGYVLREWFRLADGTLSAGAANSTATLQDARELLPEGAVCIQGRDPSDPVILEVWM